MRRKIYLSPSNQSGNRYAVAGTNEKEQKEAVAKHVKRILETEYDCDPVMATLTLGIETEGRPKEASDRGCDLYLALHSNAGGGGKASDSLGKSIAQRMVTELGAICPIPSNRIETALSGMTQYKGFGLAEIRNPSKLGMTAVLLEVDFHDNPKPASWILSSKEAIARAIVAVLVKVCDIPKKPNIKTVESATSPKYYRVQVGAFSQKAKAEVLLKSLKTAGFSGVIKFE